MPKLFPIFVEVEEVALGHVMRVLHNTPGVARCNLMLGDTAYAKKAGLTNGHANGHGSNSLNGGKPHKNAGKPRKVFEVPGRDFLIKALAKSKGPVPQSKIKTVFEKDGRSPDSASSLLHLAKQAGTIENVAGEGYRLTKKGRDRARYV